MKEDTRERDAHYTRPSSPTSWSIRSLESPRLPGRT